MNAPPPKWASVRYQAASGWCRILYVVFLDAGHCNWARTNERTPRKSACGESLVL